MEIFQGLKTGLMKEILIKSVLKTRNKAGSESSIK